MTPFELELSRDGRATTIHVTGELDVASAPALRACVVSVLEQGQRRVIMDLAKLEFVDSTGLGALVGARKRVRESGGELVLTNPLPQTLKLLELTGLNAVFMII
ncbi:MAG: anti-sigma factor antagonist [Actinomycetota bacterium]